MIPSFPFFIRIREYIPFSYCSRVPHLTTWVMNSILLSSSTNHYKKGAPTQIVNTILGYLVQFVSTITQWHSFQWHSNKLLLSSWFLLYIQTSFFYPFSIQSFIFVSFLDLQSNESCKDDPIQRSFINLWSNQVVTNNFILHWNFPSYSFFVSIYEYILSLPSLECTYVGT